MRKLFLRNNNGITLVALVVTIIVLLILAGISLNLIAGSNGIMERAMKVVDTYDYAKLKESLELSNAEMLLDCLGGGDLETDLYDYIVKRCEESSGKIAQASNGKYWIDSDGRLYYTDNDTKGTVKLRKDSNGNPKIIDPNAPITTYRVQYDANGGIGVPTDTSEYEEGDKVNVTFGTMPPRERYTFLGWATNASATTPEYSSTGNFTMGNENVTLYAVWTGVSGIGTSVMKGIWYGDSVNYSANGVEDWKVFLNDEKNVYLIASDCIENSKINITSDVIRVSGNNYCVAGNSRDGLVNWLQTTSNWDNFKGIYASLVTGGPTLAQFVESYNEKYETNYDSDLGQSNWYLNNTSDSLYMTTTNEVDAYWLASKYTGNTEFVRYVNKSGGVHSNYYSYTNIGVRPLVKLLENVKMTWNGTSWDLSI